MLKLLLTLLLIIPALSAHAAPDPALIRQLADEDSGVRISAIEKLTLEADPASLPILKAMSDDALYAAGSTLLIVAGYAYVWKKGGLDLATRQPKSAEPKPS